jgi:hypothetical protein
LIHAINLSERHNPINYQISLVFQRSSSNPMERLTESVQTIYSLMEFYLERDESLLENEMVAENGEIRIISKNQQYPCI